jgi:hypothetical protein
MSQRRDTLDTFLTWVVLLIDLIVCSSIVYVVIHFIGKYW